METFKSKFDYQQAIRWIPLLLIMLGGMSLVWWITRSGPGMSGDSVWYKMGAENLLAGNGYLRFSGGGELRPITHFPPFYSMVLAVIGISGMDLVSAARWLNIFLLALNIFLVWLIVERESHSLILANLAAALMIVNYGTLKYYSWIMTEPLYISLSLGFLVFLLRYSRHDQSINLFVAAGLAGFSVITRLIGFSLVGTGLLFLIVRNSNDVRQKLIRGFLFFAIAIIPALLWLLHSSRAGDGTFNRTIEFHPMSIELIKGYFFFLGDWIQFHRLISGKYRLFVAVTLVSAGPILFVKQWVKNNWRRRSVLTRPPDTVIFLLLIYGALYMATLYINTTFIDASTTAYAPERYVASIYPVFVAVVLLIYFRVWERAGRKQVIALLLTVLVSSNLFLQGVSTWQEIRQNGIPLGYTEYIQEHPAFSAVVRRNAEEHIIYSNNPELTYAISGVGAYILPFEINTGTGLLNPGYGEDVIRMETDLREGGRIIHFGEKDSQQLELYKSLDLRSIEVFPEGEIYIFGGTLSCYCVGILKANATARR
jgi:hypothetical protein